MGKNTIGSLGKRLAQIGNLSSKKTNHSARKSGISMLLHDNVPPTEVMQISEHRNIQSLNSYSSLSIKQQQCLSNKLSARIANEPAAADNGLSIRQYIAFISKHCIFFSKQCWCDNQYG
jgi:hypothetical protein